MRSVWTLVAVGLVTLAAFSSAAVARAPQPTWGIGVSSSKEYRFYSRAGPFKNRPKPEAPVVKKD